MTTWEEHNKQEKPPPRPYGFIQWKGTDVCMDLNCSCGHLGHIDDEFAYSIRCRQCGQTYATGSYIVLTPIDPDDDKDIVSD